MAPAPHASGQPLDAWKRVFPGNKAYLNDEQAQSDALILQCACLVLSPNGSASQDEDLSLTKGVHRMDHTSTPDRHHVELQVGEPYANLMAGQSLFTHAVAQHFQIDPTFVFPTLGTTGAIEAVRNHALYTSGTQHPTAVTVTPGYWRARESFQGSGFKILAVSTQPGGFAIDEQEIAANVAEKRPDLLYLSLPNNPTGAIFTPEEIIQSVPETMVLMIDLTLPSSGLDTRAMVSGLHSAFAGRKNLFLLGSPSKSHRTAEYRIGWAVCTNRQDAEELRKENRNVLPTLSIAEGMKQLGKAPTVLESLSQSFALLREGERQDRFTLVKPVRRVETGYVLLEIHVETNELKHALEAQNIRVLWGSALGLTDQYIRLETMEPANIHLFIAALNSCAIAVPLA